MVELLLRHELSSVEVVITDTFVGETHTVWLITNKLSFTLAVLCWYKLNDTVSVHFTFTAMQLKKSIII